MGRKQFEAVVAQASRENMKIFSRDVTTSLNISAGEEVLVYSSPGTIAEVVGMRFFATNPAGAASGSHNWYVGYKTGISNNIDILLLQGAFGAAAQYNYGIMANGTAMSPTGGIGANKICFDSTTPLRLFYENQTNIATGTARRFIFITYIEREVRA